MNGQILTRINELENQLRVLKSLAKKQGKKVQRKNSLLIGSWKGLKATDKELAETKKAPFDFDVEKYVR